MINKTSHTTLFLIICFSALFSSVCRSEDHATVQIIKLKDFKSQDGVRDSIRFALYRVSNRDLSFWGREYPINSGFYKHGSMRYVSILKGHPDLSYKLWIQEKKAPLVFILPGLGGHFQGMGVNAMAQVYYDAGCSVVILSNAMNWEFYMAASRSKAPGYLPQDIQDVHNALFEISREIDKEYPGKVTSKHLVGYSLGGLHTLFIAELDSRCKKNKIGFDSYLAIHPPVDPYSAMCTLDSFFDKWERWQKKDVNFKIESSVAAYLSLITNGLSKGKAVKMGKEEAEVLIAYSYRNTLRELMLAICKQGNAMGLIKEEYGFTKQALYRELDRYSFAKYADTLVRKSASMRAGHPLSMKEMSKQSNLHSIEDFLKNSKNISIIHSLDDFLINNQDIIWFERIFGKRAFFFRYGGHLGELYTPEARYSIVKHLNLPRKKYKKEPNNK